jgi:hypothetical protein
MSASSEPVFILAPHRSCTSLVCAMLGQQPALVDVPETNLSTAETLREWWDMHAAGPGLNAEGLLRAVAELRFGEQSLRGVRAARWWIWCHLDLTTDHMWSALETWAAPLRMVEKSPLVAHDRRSLQRLVARWPDADYVHLVRHPVAYSASMLEMPAARDWMAELGALDRRGGHTSLDPSRLWHDAHSNIVHALEHVPPERQVRVRTEDLLAQPRQAMTRISERLGLGVDPRSVEAMLRPERSPFAHVGPPGALFGNDPSFLRDARLRTPRQKAPPTLDDVLPWRRDGQRLGRQVTELAQSFGYA